MTGAWLSATMTAKLQLFVLPATSAAAQTTVFVPLAKVEPLAGVHATVAPGQLSLTEGVKATICSHAPGALLVTMLAGQVTTGTSVSLTVMLKLQVAVLPAASVTVQVTALVPLAKAEPLAGAHTEVAPGQLSLMAGLNAIV